MRIGGNSIAAAYLGSTAISAAYLGNVQVFSGAVAPSTVDYTYAQISGALSGSIRLNSPTGKTSIGASGTIRASGFWVGLITGTDADMVFFQGTSSTPAGMIEVSIDGGAWAAAPVVGGRYVLFSGLPQASRLVLIRVQAAYGTNTNIPNSGNVLRVTGAPPSVSDWSNFTLPGDGSANTFTANALTANNWASFQPANIPLDTTNVRRNLPSIATRGNFSEMVAVTQSRYIYVSADGGAPTRYDLGTAAATGSLQRAVRITGLSGLKTYHVWTDFGVLLAVGGVVTGLTSPSIIGTLDQYGDSITEGNTGATSRGEMEGFRVAAALNRVCGAFGVAGNTIAQLLARIPAIVAAKTITGADVAIVAIGRNNTGGAFDAAETSDYQSIVSTLLTAGYGRVICRGILPEGANTWPAENGSIASIVAGFADPRVVFCDTSAWSGIATSDGTHPNDAGYDTMAAYALADYPALIGTLP